MGQLDIFPDRSPEPGAPDGPPREPLFPAPHAWRPPPPRSSPAAAIAAALGVVFVVGLVFTARHWLSKRSDERRQDEAVSHAVEELTNVGVEAEDAPSFERAVQQIRDAERGASPASRASAEGLIAFHRELRSIVANHQSLGAQLGKIHVLAAEEIQSSEDLDRRIRLLEAYAEACAAMHDQGSRPLEILVARLRENGANEDVIRGFRKGFEEARAKRPAALRASERAGVELRLAEKIWSERGSEALKVLKQEWGRWHFDAKQRLIIFDDDRAVGRWNEAVDRADDADIRMARLEAERFVLHPSSGVPILETVSPAWARGNFRSQLLTGPSRPDGAAMSAPPSRAFRRITYDGPLGPMAAVLSTPPSHSAKRPAILWVHDGFEGLSPALWDPKTPEGASLRAFVDAGFVVMAPSFRGEHNNPGQVEALYGELDDLLAALNHLTQAPDVDPQRVYLVGAGTGGTLTLIAAAATEKIRAAFALGAPLDITNPPGAYPIPFNPKRARERDVRAPAGFVGTITRPTLLFKGIDAPDVNEALRMEARGHAREAIESAASAKASSRAPGAVSGAFRVFVLKATDDSAFRAPVALWIARKIAADTAPTWQFPEAEEAQSALAAPNDSTLPAP